MLSSIITKMEIISLILFFLAILTLIWLGWIDLKLWLLPNELVFLFAALALPFHMMTDWIYGGWLFFGIGALVGGGILWGIRAIANYIYGFDTLGLGDVKLLAAAGLWLGPEAVMMALSLGAACGVVHAMSLAVIRKKSLNRMMLPAGPGFISGILIVLIYHYKDVFL